MIITKVEMLIPTPISRNDSPTCKKTTQKQQTLNDH